MTIAAARLLKSHEMTDEPIRSRVRLANLAEQPTSNDHFEPLSLVSRPLNSQGTLVREKDAALQSAIAACNSAAVELQSHRDCILEQAQAETVKLGVAIAERLLRRTLAAQPDSVVALVKTTLSWTVNTEAVRVRLHPADCELVETQTEDLRRGCSADLQFVRDETLSRGDCLVETAQGVIDGRIGTMLDRITEELLAD